MEESPKDDTFKHRKVLFRYNGKIYFSKNAERKFFFAMTVIMLLLGVLAKLGLL